jgi:hypothetical protein
MSVPDAIITNHTTELKPLLKLIVVASEGLELLVLVLGLVLVAELEVAAALAGRLESAGSVV